MFGDILLSRTDRAHPRPIGLPATEDVNAQLPEDAWGSISGVVQKLNVVNENLMIAWAGNYLQARLAIRHLGEAVQAGATTAEDLRASMDEIASEIQELSLIGLVVRQNGSAEHVHTTNFAYGVEVSTIHGINVNLAGTGQWHAQDLLPHLIEQNDRWAPMEQAIYTGIGLSGALVGRELDRGSNLAEMWGGAIEIGFVANGKIQKLDRVLHLQSRVSQFGDATVDLVFRPKLTHYKYLGDYLLVSTIEWTEDGSVVENRHLVSPLLRKSSPPAEEAMQPHDFGHDYICFYTSFDDGISDSSYLVSVIAAHESQVLVQRDGTSATLSWTHDLMKAVLDQTRGCLKAGYRYE